MLIGPMAGHAAEQPSATAPAPKKKNTLPPGDYFTGNPPIELLVDLSKLSFDSRAPCCWGGGRPLVVKNGYLYRIDSSDTPIKKISTETGEITPLAARTGSPVNAVIHNDAILWIEYTDTVVVEGTKSRLNRTSLDGLSTIALADGFYDVNTRGSLEILADATNVYWVNTVNVERCLPSGSCAWGLDWLIQKVPLAGGPSTTLARVQHPIVSIARDDTYLYWTEAPDFSRQELLKKVPLAGGAVEVVVDGWLNGAATAWSPTGNIVVEGGEIFFAAFGNGVMKVPVSGGAVTLLTSLSTGEGINKIIIDSTTIYWLDSSVIKQAPRSGGSSSVLLSGLLFPAGDFMIHNGNVIWSDKADRHVMTGRINTMLLVGGPVTTLLTGLEDVRAFTTDGASLYFIDGGYIRENSGKIAKISFTGGQPSTILSAVMADISSAYAVDDVNLYFSDFTGIKKVPIDGGVVDILSQGIGQAGDLLTDGEFIYWLDDFLLKKVPVDGGPVALVTIAVNADRLFLDDAHLYWTEDTSVWNGSSSEHLNIINKAPKTGGSPEVIVSGPNLAMVGLDGSEIYFLEAGYPNLLKKISIDGGPITFIGGAADGSTFTFDATYVYWGDYFSLQRAPKSGGSDSVIAMQPGIAYLTSDENALYWLLVEGLGIIKLQIAAIDSFLTLYAPNAGDVWTIGSRQMINWGFRGRPGTAKVEISRDGGVTWASISKKSLINTTWLNWKVTKPATNNARIRICFVGPSSTTCDSSENFTIQ
jgi:hypothetical protein